MVWAPKCCTRCWSATSRAVPAPARWACAVRGRNRRSDVDVWEGAKTLSLALVFAFSSAGFLLIYFGFGGTTWLATRRLFPALGWGRPLPGPKLLDAQVRREIGAALV